MKNLSMLKTVYVPPVWRRRDFHELKPGEFPMELVSDAALFMNIKDNETGETEIKMIERPSIDFYIMKDEFKCSYPQMAVPRDQLDVYNVEYSKREKEIAKVLGIENEYTSRKKQYNYDRGISLRNWVAENIYNNPDVYYGDMDIEDHYKTLFIEKYGNNVAKLNKSFADIETLVAFSPDADQNNPTAPINLISYYDQRMNTMYAFVLNVKEIPEIENVKNNLEDYINNEIEKMYDETFDEMYTFFEKTKSKSGYVRPIKRPHINTNIRFYNSEEILIIDFFNTVNNNKPDVCAWWNMNYDIKYIIGRCEILGIDYNELFCHPEIPSQYRRCRYVEDNNRTRNDGKSKAFQLMWDTMTNPGYTEYIDMMSLYANFRKRFQERSYKLDYISEITIGTKKVNLEEFGCNIFNAPIKQFRMFLKYSIKDTFLLYLMDEELGDLTKLFHVAGNTRVQQYPKISVVIKNLINTFARENNMVIGNNVKYGEWESLNGALVADPKLIDVKPDKRGLTISLVFSHVVDFDASSEYPNIMIVFNIGKDASYGRVTKVVDRKTGNVIMSGTELAHAIQASETSILDLGNELFGLPSINEIMAELEGGTNAS